MAFLTKSAFSKLAGVSRQRISKMCQLNHLVVRPDGKIDTEDRTNSNYLKKQERPDGLKYNDVDEVKEKKSKKIKKEEIKNTFLEGESFLDPEPTGSLSDMSRSELDKLKKIEEIKEKRIKNMASQDVYIDRLLVKKTFSEIYRIEANEFLQMGHSISGIIANQVYGDSTPSKILNINKIIEDESYKTLKNIKSVIDRFLGEINRPE